MATLSHRVVSCLVVVAALALVRCSEPTAATRQFAILNDVGQSDWQTVSVGADHSCAIKSNGSAYCWGSNQYGQLGIARFDTTCGTDPTAQVGCSLVPAQVQPGVKFTSISAGAHHTCAITVSREAYCWGSNDLGQVSDGSGGGATLVKVAGSLGWSQISAGYSHTCAVRTDGVVFCWGANERGQLGNGGFVNNGTARVNVPAPVASLSAGQSRTCARTTSNTVYCWGAIWTSRSGGLEVTRSQTSPQLVPAAPALAWVSVGSFTTCGTDASGFAYCWEANPRGEMGTGTETGSTTPLRVATNLEFLQVSAGIVQTCGVATSGAAYCWGDDTFGQLGVSPSALTERCSDQGLPCSTTPVPVFGRQQFVEVSTGFGSHTCGVTTRGNLYCWGLGGLGQRGDGTEGYAVSFPVLVQEPR